MDEPVFKDKGHRPTDADLARMLGPAKSLWDDFISHVNESVPKVHADWKHYAGKSGWTFVIRDQRRNLSYMKAAEDRFTASFAFNDQAVEAAEKAKLPQKVLRLMRESPKYPEGRAARIEVKSPADLRTLMKLFALKVGH